MDKKDQDEVNRLAKSMSKHLIIDKALWLGSVKVDIDHIDNDFSKPLDYLSAFKKMDLRIQYKSLQRIDTKLLEE